MRGMVALSKRIPPNFVYKGIDIECLDKGE